VRVKRENEKRIETNSIEDSFEEVGHKGITEKNDGKRTQEGLQFSTGQVLQYV
jgi:hypothetical protein